MLRIFWYMIMSVFLFCAFVSTFGLFFLILEIMNDSVTFSHALPAFLLFNLFFVASWTIVAHLAIVMKRELRRLK